MMEELNHISKFYLKLAQTRRSITSKPAFCAMAGLFGCKSVKRVFVAAECFLII